MMHYPKSDAEWLILRHDVISSTESAALFGVGSYATPFEIAVEKKSPVVTESLDIGERPKWGKRLEDAIAKGISEDFGVKVRRANGYAIHDSCKLGASFDYEIIGISKDESDSEVVVPDNVLQQMYRDCGPGILEIKNVDRLIFRREWKTEDGTLEAPPQFEIQVQHQLEAINTRKWSCIGVLIGGNETQILIRERDEDFGKLICQKVNAFWKLLADGGMPPVTLPADVDVIRKIYLGSSPGKIFDGATDTVLAELCRAFDESRDVATAAEQSKKSIMAKILMRIGDAEKALAPGFRISAGTVGATWIERYERKAYRSLRITKLAEKVDK